MRAIASCPKCNEKLVSDCRGCIENSTSCGGCSCGDVVEGVKWKVLAENEKELLEEELNG